MAPNALSSFEKFPAEIRRAIWLLAAAELEPRTVSVSMIKNDEKWRIAGDTAELADVDLLKTTSKVPSLLCVNYEARHAAKSYYEQIAGETLGQPRIFFRFGVDTLFITGYNVWSVLFRSKEPRGSPEQANTIGKLQFLTIDIPNNPLDRCHDPIAQRFPMLKVLSLWKFTKRSRREMVPGFLDHHPECRAGPAEKIRHFQEYRIPEDYKNIGGGPIVLWRDRKALSQLAEAEKNGKPVQARKNLTDVQ